MNLQQYQEDTLKKFEEKFELVPMGCSECGGDELRDKKEVQYPKGEYHCEYNLEKIKEFLLSSLKGQLEVVEEIKSEESNIQAIAVEVVGDATKPKRIDILITLENTFRTISFIPKVELLPSSFGYRYTSYTPLLEEIKRI